MKSFKKNPKDDKNIENETTETTKNPDFTPETTEESAINDIEIQTLKEENAKLKDEFLRAYADAENTKKRCAQEIEKNNKYAISSFAKELLSVADNLHRAIDSIPDDHKDQQALNQ